MKKKSFLSLFSNLFILFSGLSVQLPLTRKSFFVCLIDQIWPSIGLYVFRVLLEDVKTKYKLGSFTNEE